MSKVNTESLLVAVQSLACAYGSASAALTGAACDALLGECHVDDVIYYMTEGFLEAGQTGLPSGMASNLKRLAAAGPKHIQAVRDTGNALNNKMLSLLNVPTTGKGGRPKGQGAGKTTKPSEEKEAPITASASGYSVSSALLTIQGMRATAPKWAPGQYALLTLLDEVIDALKGDVISCSVEVLEDDEVEA